METAPYFTLKGVATARSPTHGAGRPPPRVGGSSKPCPLARHGGGERAVVFLPLMIDKSSDADSIRREMHVDCILASLAAAAGEDDIAEWLVERAAENASDLRGSPPPITR